MLSTSFPPATLMCASCGVVMIRSVLKSPCDFIYSSVCESCFSNSASIKQFQSKSARCKTELGQLIPPATGDKKRNVFAVVHASDWLEHDIATDRVNIEKGTEFHRPH